METTIEEITPKTMDRLKGALLDRLTLVADGEWRTIKIGLTMKVKANGMDLLVHDSVIVATSEPSMDVM